MSMAGAILCKCCPSLGLSSAEVLPSSRAAETSSSLVAAHVPRLVPLWGCSLPSCCLAAAWLLPGRCLAAAWPLPGRCLAAAWPLRPITHLPQMCQGSLPMGLQLLTAQLLPACCLLLLTCPRCG